MEDKLFETTEKPTEDTEFTTEMDFMYPMIMDPVTTTKRPEPKMTTSIIDKVVEFLTTTPTPAIIDDSEFFDDDSKDVPETTIVPGPETDLENKLFEETEMVPAETTVPSLLDESEVTTKMVPEMVSEMVPTTDSRDKMPRLDDETTVPTPKDMSEVPEMVPAETDMVPTESEMVPTESTLATSSSTFVPLPLARDPENEILIKETTTRLVLKKYEHEFSHFKSIFFL